MKYGMVVRRLILRWFCFCLLGTVACTVVPAGAKERSRSAALSPQLTDPLKRLTAGFPGRVGVGVRFGDQSVTLRRHERFSLQSVVKLIVAAACLDAVDRGKIDLHEPLVLHRQDLSLNVQPLADEVIRQGELHTTPDDLIVRAVTQSDSAANDYLYKRVGGAGAIQGFLERRGIAGIRVDRDERHLQTETSGLTWKPEDVDAERYERAKAAVPRSRREAAFRAYQRDPRDTATPQGMAVFLADLAEGRLLSPASTRYLLGVMERTTTSPDRLKAGTPAGWKLGHKTGTSGSWEGVTVATNDVGVLTAPSGEQIAIAVFIADSNASDKDRAALIARIAATVTAEYHPTGK